MHRNERHHHAHHVIRKTDAAPQQPTTYGVCPCSGEGAQIIFQTHRFLDWPSGGYIYSPRAASSGVLRLVLFKANSIKPKFYQSCYFGGAAVPFAAPAQRRAPPGAGAAATTRVAQKSNTGRHRHFPRCARHTELLPPTRPTMRSTSSFAAAPPSTRRAGCPGASGRGAG